MNFYYIALQNVCYLSRLCRFIRAFFSYKKYSHSVLFHIKELHEKDLTGNVKPETKVFEWVCEMWFILLLYTMFKKEVSWYLGKMLWPELYFYPSLNGQGDKILTKLNLKYYYVNKTVLYYFCTYMSLFHSFESILDEKHYFCLQFVENPKKYIFSIPYFITF